MATGTILAVEDEGNILELITYNLEREGYEVIGASSGEEGLRAARSRKVDLVLLDLMLPGIDGLEVCRRLKADARSADIPVVIVSARGGETDVVVGLELGADDYVTKPFSPRILAARVGAVLRRRAEPPGETDSVSRGELVMNRGRRETAFGGRVLELTFTEFEILFLLARHPGWVFTRSQIVSAVRGADYHVTERAVDVQISGLRRKLGGGAGLVETVRGVGYRFRDER